MATTTSAQMEMAAEWLDVNQGTEESAEDEGSSCKAVAAWLREQARRIDTRAAETTAIREHAAKIGSTPSEVRRALRRMRAK